MNKIRDLIQNKNYDIICLRTTIPEGAGDEDTLIGICRSKKGELIPDIGDICSSNEEVLRFEEWENKEYGIENGLTVVVAGHWLT